MKVIVSDLAEADIETITDFIAEDSPRRALSYAAELRAACYGLGDTPYRFAILERYRRFGLRRRVHGAYSIIYRVTDSVVIVLRVVSAFRDMDEALGSPN